MQLNRQKLAIVCSDLPTVRCITDAAGRHFELTWARDSNTLAHILNEATAPVAVLIDNATAQQHAIEWLESVRKARPDVRRVLLTDYCDLSLIVQGLHTGAVQHIVYKPIHGPELLAAVGAPPAPQAIPPHTSAYHTARVAG